ncbi:hypothetical protein K458DRAFT_402605 [Lentithecium fluviatile CBS 122367]|uniref:Zn(2)-C6 fungal-type domain-containing protein n=1 Tax=Lentithecium fluviatile CBS 122367 TaxID=1168545 RepID=A0A6G1J781_9PLEO|nr:hypothetical protein K458DRAFT_402605 [Lentithecium fluviatile CBS 122367]
MEGVSASSSSARRLRSSCDACGIAKTKCDRGQPQCTRCVALNLPCVYGPSRQFGKRPRRRLDVSRNVAPESTNASSLRESGALGLERLSGGSNLPKTTTYTSSENNTQFELADMDPALFLPSLPISWPGFDNLAGSNDIARSTGSTNGNYGIPTPPATVYEEANEILQSLTVHRTGFDPDTVLIEVSRVLEANKRAVESVALYLKSEQFRQVPHLTMLYASIIARVLEWYQEAAGYGNHFASRHSKSPNGESSIGPESDAVPQPGTADVPMATRLPKCFSVQPLPFTVGTFNVEEPCIQRTFRNQLVCHEVKKLGVVIEDFIALAANERVAAGDRIMYSALGVWLKSEHEKTTNIFKNAIRRTLERLV